MLILVLWKLTHVGCVVWWPPRRYGSLTKPMSIAKDIEKLLAMPKDNATTTCHTTRPHPRQHVGSPHIVG